MQRNYLDESADGAHLDPGCDVAIVGGGIVGASIAYHLARGGRRSVQLLERGELTCGTTWHAAGLVAELRASVNLTRLARYSGELYEQLEADGYPTGFRRVGALTLALGTDRREELCRQAAFARSVGVDCRWLRPEELAERWPHMELAGVVGGVWMPRDGQTNPVDTTQALARRARELGAGVYEHVGVSEVRKERAGYRLVTTAGEVRARQIVLAAGLWTRELALQLGAHVPIQACEHFYVVTESVDLPKQSPIVRVPDEGVYLKPDAGRLLIGCFEDRAKPLPQSALPADFSFDELPFDLEHVAPYLEAGLSRVPAARDVGLRTLFNGPEGFTPDGRYQLGELPGAPGAFVAAGFNSIGIQSAGGVGRVMAEWVEAQAPSMDLWEVDVRRFSTHDNGAERLRERAGESLGLLYQMHWPHRQMTTARDVLRSPLHALTDQAGAVYGELAGWERPNWYAASHEAREYRYSWDRASWFDAAAREHRAAREDLALFDQSSFAKFEISGPEALSWLNGLCTSDLNAPIGSITYTQLLNERGGIEADVTITRTAQNRFLYVTAAACRVRDADWLQRQAASAAIAIDDVTEKLAVIGVMGPRSRSALSTLCPAPLDNETFPFATSQGVEIAGRPARASRISYVGSLGWELYVAPDDAVAIWQALLDQEAVPAGYHAMDSLRMEKAYRHWGHDLSDEDSPLEAGLSFTVAWDKPGGFLGREALVQQRQMGLDRRLLLFQLKPDAPFAFHDEPIWHDGERVGRVTSGAFGYTVGAPIAFGYVSCEPGESLAALCRRDYEIEIGERFCPTRAHRRALVDPSSSAVRL